VATKPLRSYIKILNPIEYVNISSFTILPSTGFGSPSTEYMAKFSGTVSPGFPLDSIVLKDLTIAFGSKFRDTLYVSTFYRLGDFTLTKVNQTYYATFKPGDVSFLERVSWLDDGSSIEPTIRNVGTCYLMARTPYGMRILCEKLSILPPINYRHVNPAWKGEIQFYFFLSPYGGEWTMATKCTGYPPPPPPPPPQPTATAIQPTIPPETIEEAIKQGLLKPPPPRYGPCLNKITSDCSRIFVVDFEYVPNPHICITSARTNGYVILSSAGAQEFTLDYTTTHGNPVMEFTVAKAISGYLYRADSILANGVPLRTSPWPLSLDFPIISTFYL
jgi:hypothetical protein